MPAAGRGTCKRLLSVGVLLLWWGNMLAGTRSKAWLLALWCLAWQAWGLVVAFGGEQQHQSSQ
jgi:hypothetical protein